MQEQKKRKEVVRSYTEPQIDMKKKRRKTKVLHAIVNSFEKKLRQFSKWAKDESQNCIQLETMTTTSLNEADFQLVVLIFFLLLFSLEK